MRVLITRPEPDATKFADQVKARGHEAVIAPLLTIQPVAHPSGLPPDLATVLFTSANAVRCFRGERAEVPTFVTGPATASVAEEFGWTDVRVAGGDAATLLDVVRDTLDPTCGTLLHLRGHDVAVPLAKELAADGYRVEERWVYLANPISELPTVAARQLASGEIDAALFFSARTAEAFGQLLTPKIRLGLKRVRALALSIRIAAELPEGVFASVEIAPRPRSDAMLELLNRPVRQTRSLRGGPR